MGKDEKKGEGEKEREQEIEEKNETEKENYGLTVHFPAGLCESPSLSVPLICHR